MDICAATPGPVAPIAPNAAGVTAKTIAGGRYAVLRHVGSNDTLDQTVAQIIGTPGEFYWGGAASTAFFVNPNEDLIMIFLTQLRPSSTYPIRRELRQTIYSALIE
jgi:CubicO group peptidase (beta-lactamase class C family)